MDSLLNSGEPSLRWKARVNVLRQDPDSRVVRKLQEEVRRSPRVRALLTRRDRLGRKGTSRGVYYYWQGCHWVLASLADLGYPPSDMSLRPLRDRILDHWLSAHYFREFTAKTKGAAYRGKGVPIENGRYRRCASQQGNALYFLTRLCLDDGRCEQLVERLRHWQWPDGGWNCDRDPAADTSSFHETLLPMLGLATYARTKGSPTALESARIASEVFLRRRLFRRLSDGRVIQPDFVRLRYPSYWHYDVLHALSALEILGRIADPRCQEALDLIEGKRLPDGGWPAEEKLYKAASSEFVSGFDWVDWGGSSQRRSNPWVTVDALTVLNSAGRLEL